ncbi:MAG TPA: hypothetical protein ENK50_06175 [Sedimenticola sp.]|nr:hypothetical protein [Sedimenticola sp.]
MRKVVSGGQTGVDRGALDAAMAHGVAVGGWCPEGRLAEDGRIPARYPLRELPGAGYRQRTRQNVIDSEGTLIIHFGPVTGGTRETLLFCEAEGRPCLQVDALCTTPGEALPRVRRFIGKWDLHVLNVAGPRASGEPLAQGYARELVGLLLGGATGSRR